MDYSQAEEYILGFTDYEKIPGILYTSANYDLRRMDELLQPLGNPQLTAKTVHIAGTKGKGSTSAMITEVLTTSGYRTGLFTSPHLHTLRERIRMGKTLISETEFASLVTELKPVIELINNKANYGKLTTFEILTAVAFIYFQRKGAEFQVIEVGLGGRLDATNVVIPQACVLTSISLDHTEVLGDTIAKIAMEKAGIIKPGCTVISAPQENEANEVIQEVCHKQRVRLIRVGEDITWQRKAFSLSQQSLVVKGLKGSYNLTIPLLGSHQLENAATAVATLEVLASLGAEITTQDVTRGMSQVEWQGRLQILNYSPLIVVDGAHSAYSMRKLVEAIREYFDYQQCFFILGASSDKDITGMVREIISLAPAQVIATRSQHPRAASPSLLADILASHSLKNEIAENVFEALSRVLALARDKDLICVTGSLFVVAEAIGWNKSRQRLMEPLNP